jgi:hypothetical protein
MSWPSDKFAAKFGGHHLTVNWESMEVNTGVVGSGNDIQLLQNVGISG